MDAPLERDENHDIAMKVTSPPAGDGHSGHGAGSGCSSGSGAATPSDQSKPSKTLFVTVARNVALGQGGEAAEALEWQLGETRPYGEKLPLAGLEAGRPAPKEACLICAIPLTGRTHQIRLHVAHAGYPIIGDPVYGVLCDAAMDRQALHAFKLQVVEEPPLVNRAGFLAPLPPDMRRCLDILGIESKSVEDINAMVAEALLTQDQFHWGKGTAADERAEDRRMSE